MIGISPILSKEMTAWLIRAADAQGIAYQREVMPRTTGTNADHIATARAGVETGLVSIPLKYMHTPVEMAAISDIEDAGKLLAALVKDFAREGAGV